jgi:monoamine oxidase
VDSPGLDVLILGAGALGIAAADRLFGAGLRVGILEASDRVGGRARTDYSLANGFPLELGAQMIHGRSVVTQRWVREAGLTARSLPVQQRARFVVGGRVARPPWMALPFYPGFGPIRVHQAFRAIPRAIRRFDGPDRPLSQFLNELRPSAGVRSIVELLHAHTYAADADQIGIRGPGEEESLASEEFGFRNYQLCEGYSELMRRRAQVHAERIRLNCPVTQVRWDGPFPTVIISTSVRAEPEELRARRVLVTLPLGVLKAHEDLFDPPLPPAKRQAIRSLGVGDAFALQLRFSGDPWPARLGDLSTLWAGGASSFHRPRVGLRGSAEYVTAFTVGTEARRRAALPDAEMREATLVELHEALPGQMGREAVLVGSVVERWSRSPFFEGGYSYLPPGVTRVAREELARSVDEKVFFAGEATHSEGEAGTVHGAIETGYFAAEEILRSRSNDPERSLDPEG